MVYYIKAMAKGAAKMALPIAFAASALTPAMAGETGNTTLKLKGLEVSTENGIEYKIAYDETKEVAIVLTAQAEDNLSYVEFDVVLPKGLEYVPGTFQKKSLDQLKNHTFKMEPTTDGFHVGIYNDDMKPMGTLTNDTIATFEVKANTNLTGKDTLGLVIRDLTDAEADQLDFENYDEQPELEGTEGDNSIGIYGIGIDENMIPGSWEVYVTGDNLNATRDTMTIDPDQTVYTPQTVEVNLRVSEAKVGGIQFNLMLPEGMSLLTETVEANAARTKEKAANYKVISVDQQETNDYVIFISGDTKAIDGKDGVLLSFQVVVDQTNTMAAEDSIKLEGIRVTSIHNVTLEQDNIKVVVENLNQAAKDRIDIAYNIVDAFAKLAENNNDRVYDYSSVLMARNAVLNRLSENYWDGVLHLDGNEAAIMGLIKAYEDAVIDFAKANSDLYKQYTEVDLPALIKDLKECIPTGVSYGVFNNSRLIADKPATDYTVEDFIDPAVKEKYDAAYAAIEAFENKVYTLWDAKDSVDAPGSSVDMYDGELLTDQADAEFLLQAAKDAIDDFKTTLDEVNASTADDMEKLIDDNDPNTNTDLAGILDDVVKYVNELSPANHPNVDGALLNEDNFPEVKEAIDSAKAAIEAAHKPVADGKAAGTLPFTEGITPVVEAFQAAKDAIDAVKDLADELMEDNDSAYNERYKQIHGQGGFQQALDESVIREPLQETQTYKDAVQAVQDAIDAYQNLLDEKDVQAMVAKSTDTLNVAAAEVQAKLDDLQAVIGNLTQLNDKIVEVNNALDAAKQALENLLNDPENPYIEDGVKTKDLIDAIQNEIDDIENDLAAITDDINNAGDWEELLNENGEVDQWNEELDDLLNRITNTDPDEEDVMQAIDEAKETYDKYHKRGDANIDGNVTPIDYYTILQYVREELDVNDVDAEHLSQLNVVQEPDFVNPDGTPYIEINITDAVAALLIYHNFGSDEGLGLGERLLSRAAEAESLTKSESTVNGVRRIALNLNSNEQYTAAQMDVMLPEGMKIAGATLGSRNNGHDLFVGKQKDGRQRIVISSDQLATFNGTDGAVLYLDVEGNGDVEFQNVIFTTVNAQSSLFEVTEAQTTGISGTTANTTSLKQTVYNIGGRLMNGLKKGINIIRQADGTTQKVIK